MFQLKSLILATIAVCLAAGPDCFAALAEQVSGRKRFTGRLSSNKVVRKQQLIVDPEGIIGGSVSVNYDTRVVRLVSVIDPGEFAVTGGLVSVVPALGGLSPTLLPIDEFFTSQAGSTDPSGLPTYREQGYVQVFFESRDVAALRAPNDSAIDNLPGYVTVYEDGPTGINDTHALLFEYLPGVPEWELARYTIYATPPRDLTVPDSITLADDPENPISYREIGSASLGGSLVYDEPRPIPLPPAALVGGAMLAAIVGVRASRRPQK